MNVYAYLGIYEVVAKLLIVYLLSISPFDKLVFYAFLMFLVHLSIFVFYWMICRHKYPETHLSAHFSKKTFLGMLGFTGWTAVANVSNSIIVQGAILLLNLFFVPAIIASKALANQVTHALMQFVHNFRVAMNPQIIKYYAAGCYEESRRMTLKSTVISFDLMLIIGMPFIFTMETILNLWLVEVPDQAVRFTQVAVLAQILNTIPSSTYVAFVASGKQQRNALWGIVSGLAYFLSLYIVYKCGGEAIWVQYLFVVYVLSGIFLLRPLLLHKEMDYSYTEIAQCYWNCFKPLSISWLIAYFLSILLYSSIAMQIVLFVTILSSTTACCFFLMEKELRAYIISIVYKKFNKKKV